MNKEVNVEVKADSDGAIFLECPYCNKKFKVFSIEYQNTNLEKVFCSYCGECDSPQNFIPNEIVEEGFNRIQNMLNKEIDKMFDIFNNTEFIKVEKSPLQMTKEQEMSTEETNDKTFQCSKCQKSFKILEDMQKDKVYCPYCKNDKM